MNEPRMTQLIEAITAASNQSGPEHAFNMNDWVNDLDMLNQTLSVPAADRVDHALSCGFVGCAAGWTAVLANVKLRTSTQALAVFVEWLEVTLPEGRYFCHGFWFPDDQPMETISAADVVEALILWRDTGSLHYVEYDSDDEIRWGISDLVVIEQCGGYGADIEHRSACVDLMLDFTS